MAKITVLGDGAFGTAIAQLLAHNGHQVTLWCYQQAIAQEINSQHTNTRFLPGIELNKNIQAIARLPEALHGAEFIFEAIPVKFLRTIIMQAAPYVQKQTWVTLSKGIEQDTLLFPTQIIQELVPTAPCVVLSGPSYAHDVARGEPTLVSLAAQNTTRAQEIAQLVCNKNFSVTMSGDVIGVQACAAYKNVAAIAIGAQEGAGYGHNARTLTFMRALDEMRLLVTTLGGNPETAYSPAGVGDLALTALGGQSKNRALGQALGDGQKPDYTNLPEGANTIVSLMQLAQKLNTSLPLCATVYNMLYTDQSVAKSLTQLVEKTGV